MKMVKKMFAEFIGTAVLVVFGCGTAVAAATIKTQFIVSTLVIAFAFGLALIAMAYSIGNVSGCHINPSVSLAMLITGKMTFKDFIGYIIAQFLGAIAGAGVLALVITSAHLDFTKTGLGQNGFTKDISKMGVGMPGAFMVEVILTFVFVIAVLGVTSKTKNSSVSGIVIGLTLTLVHILGIPFTGTSVNPARSFGPALFMGGIPLSQVWVFIAAPLVGAAIAAIVWQFIQIKEEK